jgi:hypothetical protein
MPTAKLHFRILLPVIETVSTAVFGGVGLWQRHQILSQHWWGGQTLYYSTARFHVWPWPYKLAVITNLPAFLAAGMTEWPFRAIWPDMPDAFGWALFLLFAAATWYWLGARFDSHPKSRRRHLAILLSFTVLSIAGVFAPGYVGYVPYAILLWLILYGAVVITSKRAALAESVDT